MTKHSTFLNMALMTILLILVGCISAPPPTSAIQLHGESGTLSNFTWVSIDVNLTPLNNNEALLDSIYLSGGIFTPACGYIGQIEIHVYSNGNLVWEKSAPQNTSLVQPIPLMNVSATVKPDSRIVVAQGNAYVQLDYSTQVGHMVDLGEEIPICQFLPDLPGETPPTDLQNNSPAPGFTHDLFSQGSIRLDIPPANQTPTSEPAPTVTTSSANCFPPGISDLSFAPSSPVAIGALVNINAKANWNSCFRAMRLIIDDNVAYELGQPTFTYLWDTSGVTAGNHKIRLEVAALGDDNWSNPSVQEAVFTLQTGAIPAPKEPNATVPNGTVSTACTLSIEDFSFNPSSPSTIGTTVNIHAKATSNSCFRSMRILIDGSRVYEQSSPQWTYNWNTSNYGEGNHTIRLEVAALGDNNWTSPFSQDASYTLQSGITPTAVSCTAPPIEDLSFNPASPSAIGTTVNIHAKATWNSCFRSMRILIDGSQAYEQSSPEWTYNWNTSNYGTGNHTIRLEVAALGDNSWSNPSNQDASYTLQSAAAPTSVSCVAPPVEDLSFNPGSPSAIGTTVNIHAKAKWNSCFRSMRLKIDGEVVYEQSSPEWTYNWNTSSYGSGSHSVRLEVAALGDNGWTSPFSRDTSYSLQSAVVPTSVSCAVPPIEDLSFNPSSSASVGTTVNIHAKATWNSCFRSMRILIDGNPAYEQSSPEWTFGWNTYNYSVGSHTVRLEVAALGDNSWSNPSYQDASYNLLSAPPPPPSPTSPPPSGLGQPSLASPSNGTLIPPGTDITVQWNSVNGATQYLVEIWGGQYGGTHAQPCGWQSGTSCHIGTMSPGNVLWHVMARDGSGNYSSWSGDWNFTPQ